MSDQKIPSSSQIRQSFLDFFESKQHTIVPSSSLMPDAPNLLFTNAGMNQFVPIFLGEQRCPYQPGRAADTQKCIRAGGKHNDLEDVGLDTYHHTFFEMLGNWSFGDYFKKEAIEWAWELIIGVWKVPQNRVYATVYQPDPSKGDPGEFDREAYDHWERLFSKAGLDPKVHIVNGGKKDNFWMMGETGPCGPCSEIHVDLTQNGDTEGRLVNADSPECIELWNLVFIQMNANPDGSFSDLPAKHVDTGMGFERVTSIIQNTKGFTTFGETISNYETDIFRPIFDRLEQLSGKKYGSTLPGEGAPTSDAGSQVAIDVAFRVIADHIRTLSFSIADGIIPGNTDRNYVLRRILRRAVRYGRTLGLHEPFFFKLVDVLVETMGQVFGEIKSRHERVKETIQIEEEAFNKTLDRGIALFLEEAEGKASGACLSGEFTFKLYDTYGFPLDLTELMARERGLSVDSAGFDSLMEQQRARARSAQKKQVISVSEIETEASTEFVGFQALETDAKVEELVTVIDKVAVILDRSPCYAEMGGQVGDKGALSSGGKLWHVANTQKVGNAYLHFIDDEASGLEPGTQVQISVDIARRRAIQRHHTVTHLLHWALHEVVSQEASQKGAYVGPEKLTFDFNGKPLTPQQVEDVERLVNERVLESEGVSWHEVPYAEVKDRQDVMQFFGDKYGERVRVVQIGGRTGALDGYSMELCGGTHTRLTGEIGLFRVVGEAAIAAGVRRIEAVAGLTAYDRAKGEEALIQTLAGRVNAPIGELEKKVESLLAHQKVLEKQIKRMQQQQATHCAKDLMATAKDFPSSDSHPSIRVIAANLGDVDGGYLQATADALKGEFNGVVVLGGATNGSVALLATVSKDFTKQIQAGKIIQAIAPIVGGKGGGRPDNARGGGKDATKLDEALAKALELF